MPHLHREHRARLGGLQSYLHFIKEENEARKLRKKARPNLSRRRLAGSEPNVFICLSVCAWWKVNPCHGCPVASHQPWAWGRKGGKGHTIVFAHANIQGIQGKQEGDLRFPVFVLWIFSLTCFFLNLSPRPLCFDKSKEGVDCKHPLRYNYFTIITFTGRTCRAILLSHPLHFNLSFTLLFLLFLIDLPQQAQTRHPSPQQERWWLCESRRDHWGWKCRCLMLPGN